MVLNFVLDFNEAAPICEAMHCTVLRFNLIFSASDHKPIFSVFQNNCVAFGYDWILISFWSLIFYRTSPILRSAYYLIFR